MTVISTTIWMMRRRELNVVSLGIGNWSLVKESILLLVLSLTVRIFSSVTGITRTLFFVSNTLITHNDLNNQQTHIYSIPIPSIHSFNMLHTHNTLSNAITHWWHYWIPDIPSHQTRILFNHKTSLLGVLPQNHSISQPFKPSSFQYIHHCERTHCSSSGTKWNCDGCLYSHSQCTTQCHASWIVLSILLCVFGKVVEGSETLWLVIRIRERDRVLSPWTWFGKGQVQSLQVRPIRCFSSIHHYHLATTRTWIINLWVSQPWRVVCTNCSLFAKWHCSACSSNRGWETGTSIAWWWRVFPSITGIRTQIWVQVEVLDRQQHQRVGNDECDECGGIGERVYWV